jgi:hypothetical protein
MVPPVSWPAALARRMGLLLSALRVHDDAQRDGEAEPIGLAERLEALREPDSRRQRRVSRLEPEKQGQAIRVVQHWQTSLFTVITRCVSSLQRL